MTDSNNQSQTEGERYALRGVSSSKKEVHDAVDKLDQGLFPGTFCKVTKDYLTGDENKCNIIHADGSGTKSTLAYMAYKETGDPSFFKGISQDSIVMNIDDLLCVGATNPILISSTVNRNARNFPGEALAALIEGTEEFIQSMRDLGVPLENGGGETADVGDLTDTVTVDSCAVSIMNRDDVICNSWITEGLDIIGLASYGKANYESFENSGIGSNGLTSARHDLLSKYYAEKYPETFDKNTPEDLVYCGPYKMDDKLPNSNLTVGEAILSPTRTYAPFVASLLKDLRKEVKGLVHCSGGGQTKCLRFGTEVHHIKDNLFQTAPIFEAIQKHSGTSWREMYQVYNMGHRLEVFIKPERTNEVLDIAKSYGIDAQIIGRTEKSNGFDNQVTIKDRGESFTYKL